VGEALRNDEKECRHYTLNDSLQVSSALDTILQQIHDMDSEERGEDPATAVSA
jgi:hypothetical protein